MPSRIYMAGGYWDVENDFRYRQVSKYGLKECKWGLEKWLSSAIYGTPELWEAKTIGPEGFLGVGPFPVHGEFELVTKFSTGRGPQGYVPLEPGTVDLTARLCWTGKVRTVWDIRNAIRTEEELKILQQDQLFDRLWEDRTYTRPGLTVGVGGSINKAEKVEEYKKKIIRKKLAVKRENFLPGFAQDDHLGDE
jgi:hypothetical protein